MCVEFSWVNVWAKCIKMWNGNVNVYTSETRTNVVSLYIFFAGGSEDLVVFVLVVLVVVVVASTSNRLASSKRNSLKVTGGSNRARAQLQKAPICRTFLTTPLFRFPFSVLNLRQRMSDSLANVSEDKVRIGQKWPIGS